MDLKYKQIQTQCINEMITITCKLLNENHHSIDPIEVKTNKIGFRLTEKCYIRPERVKNQK